MTDSERSHHMTDRQRIATRITLVRRDEITTVYGVSESTAHRWAQQLIPAGSHTDGRRRIPLYATSDIASL